jgi:protein transport protein SEC24
VCVILCWLKLVVVLPGFLQGLEAILRVRCSSGLDVDGYVGSFYKPPNSPTDLYLPAVDCDKALVARLEIVEKLPANSEVGVGCRV